jgi:hypothetical protein
LPNSSEMASRSRRRRNPFDDVWSLRFPAARPPARSASR